MLIIIFIGLFFIADTYFDYYYDRKVSGPNSVIFFLTGSALYSYLAPEGISIFNYLFLIIFSGYISLIVFRYIGDKIVKSGKAKERIGDKVGFNPETMYCHHYNLDIGAECYISDVGIRGYRVSLYAEEEPYYDWDVSGHRVFLHLIVYILCHVLFWILPNGSVVYGMSREEMLERSLHNDSEFTSMTDSIRNLVLSEVSDEFLIEELKKTHYLLAYNENEFYENEYGNIAGQFLSFGDINFIVINSFIPPGDRVYTILHETYHVIDGMSSDSEITDYIDVDILNQNVKGVEKLYEGIDRFLSTVHIERPDSFKDDLYKVLINNSEYYFSKREFFVRHRMMRRALYDNGIIKNIDDRITLSDIDELCLSEEFLDNFITMKNDYFHLYFYMRRDSIGIQNFNKL